MHRAGRPRDLRLVLPALGGWAAALIGVFWPSASWPLVGGSLAGTVIIALFGRARHSRECRGWHGLAVVVCVVMAGVALSVASATPSRERAAAGDGRVVELQAEVTSSASPGRDRRLWVDAQTIGLGAPGEVSAVSVPVRIGVAESDGVDPGARLRVIGEAEATDPGERAVLVVYATEAQVMRGTEGVFAIAAGLRHSFVQRVQRLPEPGAGLLPGLAVGDTQAVSDALNDDMRSSGLSHLTAVSGVKVTVTDG